MGKKKRVFKEVEQDNDINDGDQIIPAKQSKKILKIARSQQLELSEETRREESFSKIHERNSDSVLASDSDSDEDIADSDCESKSRFSNHQNDQQGFYAELNIDLADEKVLEKFFENDGLTKTCTLADRVEQSCNEIRTEIETINSVAEYGFNVRELDPEFVRKFEVLKEFLKNYRSGKIPKCFKFVTNLANWEQIVHITDPNGWSSAAMYQATRIFVHKLNAKNVVKFLKFILLPRIRDEIAEYKKLNFHIYEALKKSLKKAGGFMQGIVLPLLKYGNCTLREAIIVGSVLYKCSVPSNHSSVVIKKIAQMKYNGANSIFLRILLSKKYTLPFAVINAVADHFIGFTRETRELPVLWFQSLLTFVQFYKNCITTNQKKALLKLCGTKKHYLITPEIRKELNSAKCVDAVAVADMEVCESGQS